MNSLMLCFENLVDQLQHTHETETTYANAKVFVSGNLRDGKGGDIGGLILDSDYI